MEGDDRVFELALRAALAILILLVIIKLVIRRRLPPPAGEEEEPEKFSADVLEAARDARLQLPSTGRSAYAPGSAPWAIRDDFALAGTVAGTVPEMKNETGKYLFDQYDGLPPNWGLPWIPRVEQDVYADGGAPQLEAGDVPPPDRLRWTAPLHASELPPPEPQDTSYLSVPAPPAPPPPPEDFYDVKSGNARPVHEALGRPDSLAGYRRLREPDHDPLVGSTSW